MNDIINPAVVDRLLERIKKNELVGGANREENKHLRHMVETGLIESAKTKCGYRVVSATEPQTVKPAEARPAEAKNGAK